MMVCVVALFRIGPRCDRDTLLLLVPVLDIHVDSPDVAEGKLLRNPYEPATVASLLASPLLQRR